MPKKSDRPEHESAMSNLLPEVTLDEDDPSESGVAGEESNSSTELQNSSDAEEQNYKDTGSKPEYSQSELTEQQKSSPSSERSPGSQSLEDDGDPDRTPPRKSEKERLSVLPDERPDLKKKLGPYVSEEIDDALEEVYLTLRRRFGGQASKSLIVEAALRYSLSDCLRREEESEIASWMERVLEGKEG